VRITILSDIQTVDGCCATVSYHPPVQMRGLLNHHQPWAIGRRLGCYRHINPTIPSSAIRYEECLRGCQGDRVGEASSPGRPVPTDWTMR